MTDPSTTPEARLHKAKSSLEALDTHRADGLRRLRLVQDVQTQGLERERERLVAKHGAQHPLVVAAERRLELADGIRADLDVEIEKTEIDVPEVDARTWLVHGRVVDGKNQGIEGLTVALLEAGGTGVQIARTATDARGYFAIRRRVGEGANRVVLQVTDAKGRSVHAGTERFLIAGGEIAYREITVVEGQEPPDDPDDGDPTPPVPPDGWLVHGEVLQADGTPAAGMTVSLYDRDLLFDDVLGTTQTDSSGAFRLLYRTEAFRDFFERRPDLYLRVLDPEGEPLFTSERTVRARAGKVEHFRVTLPTREG